MPSVSLFEAGVAVYMKSMKIRKLFKNSSGVSAVISNLILIAAVIAVGFAALAWTYTTSNSFSSQYSNTVNSDIDQLKERIAFEFTFYNKTANNTSVYIMNFGTVDRVNATIVYVSNASWYVSFSPAQFQLKYLNGTTAASLNRNEEGYFVLGQRLVTGNSYTIKVVTGRGSSFVYAFIA